jgi:hypothetical protein
MSGKVVMEDDLNKSGVVDISGLQQGVYFIKVGNGVHVSSARFIK